MKSIEVGERIGDYEILSYLAEGGMGTVLRARHRLMNRIVANKVAKIRRENQALMEKMFRREIEASARLSHRKVLTVFDAGVTNALPYLVTQYVSGGDLQACIERSGPFSIRQTINYTIQASEGLQAIHDNGIIHRDVKPANLLIDEHGTVQILDFGISKLVGVHMKQSAVSELKREASPVRHIPNQTLIRPPSPSLEERIRGSNPTLFQTEIGGIAGGWW